MQKYLLLVMSLLISIILLLNSWFSDFLLDMLTPFLYPFFIQLPLCMLYLLCLIFSFLFVLKNHSKFLDYMPVIVLTVTLLLLLFFPFRIMRTKFELYLYEDIRNDIIKKIENNELAIDSLNNIVLPDQYKKASVSGEVTLYQNDEEGMVLGFWIFRGMLSGSVQLIYSTGGEQLIKDNETGHPIISMQQLKDQWYYVITDY